MDRVRSVTGARWAGRAVALTVLIVMVIFSFEVDQTLGALGLALVTGGTLLATPDVIEALAPPRQLDLLRRSPFWRGLFNVYLVALVVIALAGIVLLIASVAAGSVSERGTGQTLFLSGVAALSVGILGLIPVWIVDSARNIGDVLTDEMRNRLVIKLENLEADGWPVFLGAVLFVAGTFLQFIDIARG